MKIRIYNNQILLILQISFIIGLSSYYILHNIYPSIELLIAFSIAIFIWRAKNRSLLFDLLPLFILLLTFQSLRGFVDNLTPARIHILDLIAYEKAIFNGIIPAAFFQKLFYDQSYTHVLSEILNLFYMSHFLVPVIAAIIIWYQKKEHYWFFIIGLIALTYAAFITYIIYPAAPPWWATKYGYLTDQPVYLANYFKYPTLVEFAGPNQVAAMPSLHMAYPCYICMYLMSIWGKKVFWMVLLPIGVGISTLYLGHHYVIDLIAGYIFASTIFLITIWVKQRRVSKPEPIMND